MNNNEIIEKMRLSRIRSAPYLQRKLKITHSQAKKICDGLIFDKQENIYITRMNNYLKELAND